MDNIFGKVFPDAATSDDHDEIDTTTNFKLEFEAFARFGDRESDGETITLENINNWFQQSGLMSGKAKITNADIATTFSKIAKKKKSINFEEFQAFLEKLAKDKGIEIKDIMAKIKVTGMRDIGMERKEFITDSGQTGVSNYTFPSIDEDELDSTANFKLEFEDFARFGDRESNGETITLKNIDKWIQQSGLMSGKAKITNADTANAFSKIAKKKKSINFEEFQAFLEQLAKDKGIEIKDIMAKIKVTGMRDIGMERKEFITDSGQTGVSNYTFPSIDEDELDSTANFKLEFEDFARFGDRESNGETITLKNIDKWIQQSGLMSGKAKITNADTANAFSKIAKKKKSINFEEFQAFLEQLAKDKGIEIKDIMAKIKVTGMRDIGMERKEFITDSGQTGVSNYTFPSIDEDELDSTANFKLEFEDFARFGDRESNGETITLKNIDKWIQQSGLMSGKAKITNADTANAFSKIAKKKKSINFEEFQAFLEQLAKDKGIEIKDIMAKIKVTGMRDIGMERKEFITDSGQTGVSNYTFPSIDEDELDSTANFKLEFEDFARFGDRESNGETITLKNIDKWIQQSGLMSGKAKITNADTANAFSKIAKKKKSINFEEFQAFLEQLAKDKGIEIKDIMAKIKVTGMRDIGMERKEFITDSGQTGVSNYTFPSIDEDELDSTANFKLEFEDFARFGDRESNGETITLKNIDKWIQQSGLMSGKAKITNADTANAFSKIAKKKKSINFEEFQAFLEQLAKDKGIEIKDIMAKIKVTGMRDIGMERKEFITDSGQTGVSNYTFPSIDEDELDSTANFKLEFEDFARFGDRESNGETITLKNIDKWIQQSGLMSGKAKITNADTANAFSKIAKKKKSINFEEFQAFLEQLAKDKGIEIKDIMAKIKVTGMRDIGMERKEFITDSGQTGVSNYTFPSIDEDELDSTANFKLEFEDFARFGDRESNGETITLKNIDKWIQQSGLMSGKAKITNADTANAFSKIAKKKKSINFEEFQAFLEQLAKDKGIEIKDIMAKIKVTGMRDIGMERKEFITDSGQTGVSNYTFPSIDEDELDSTANFKLEFEDFARFGDRESNGETITLKNIDNWIQQSGLMSGKAKITNADTANAFSKIAKKKKSINFEEFQAFLEQLAKDKGIEIKDIMAKIKVTGMRDIGMERKEFITDSGQTGVSNYTFPSIDEDELDSTANFKLEFEDFARFGDRESNGETITLKNIDKWIQQSGLMSGKAKITNADTANAFSKIAKKKKSINFEEFQAFLEQLAKDKGIEIKDIMAKIKVTGMRDIGMERKEFITDSGQTGVSNYTFPSIDEDELDSTANFKLEFEDFARFGDRESNGETITLKNIDKWIQQSGLMSGKAKITNADTANAFSKIAKKKKSINFEEFQAFLEQLAKDKGIEIKDIMAKIKVTGMRDIGMERKEFITDSGQTGVSNYTFPAIDEDELDSTANFKLEFEDFARFGDRESNGETITLKNIDKWLQQSGLMSGKAKITNADTANAFGKIAKKKKSINFEEFQAFLEQLAKDKGMQVQDIMANIVIDIKDKGMEVKNIITAAGQTGLSNVTTAVTSGAAGANLECMTGTSQYTGSHKERLDEEGKGRGKEGREDVTEVTGYVLGYKVKDTYDEKTKKS